MAYRSVGGKRNLGIVIENLASGCLGVLDDSECELILYDKETETYYKVLQVALQPSDSEHQEVIFDLEINLEDPEQAEFKGK
jgi:hypothetical protein